MLADDVLLGIVLLEQTLLYDIFDLLLGNLEVAIAVTHLLEHLGGELEFRSRVDEFLDAEDHTELGFVAGLTQMLKGSEVTVEGIGAGTTTEVRQHLVHDNHKAVVGILLLEVGHHYTDLLCIGTVTLVCRDGIINAQLL